MPKAVVGGTLLWVAEHFVGFVDFIEACIGTLLFVDIRMILPGKATKGFFDFVFVAVAGTPSIS